MFQILLVRHGQTRADLEDRHEGWADYELTRLGEQQAALAAGWIADNFMPDTLYASPLRRTTETAGVIAKQCGLTAIYDDTLKEWNNGVLAGMLRSEALIQYPRPVGGRKLHERIPGGESAIDFRMRAEEFWSRLVGSAQDQQRICVVAHGGSITMLARCFLNLPVDESFWLACGDTGMHLWEYDPPRRVFKFSNFLGHLSGLATD